jgi:hypothetical protein
MSAWIMPHLLQLYTKTNWYLRVKVKERLDDKGGLEKYFL